MPRVDLPAYIFPSRFSAHKRRKWGTFRMINILLAPSSSSVALSPDGRPTLIDYSQAQRRGRPHPPFCVYFFWLFCCHPLLQQAACRDASFNGPRVLLAISLSNCLLPPFLTTTPPSFRTRPAGNASCCLPLSFGFSRSHEKERRGKNQIAETGFRHDTKKRRWHGVGSRVLHGAGSGKPIPHESFIIRVHLPLLCCPHLLHSRGGVWRESRNNRGRRQASKKTLAKV